MRQLSSPASSSLRLAIAALSCTGSIEVGKRADLVVLDRNLFAIPMTEIAHTRALVTLFGGRVVHGDLAAL